MCTDRIANVYPFHNKNRVIEFLWEHLLPFLILEKMFEKALTKFF